MFPRDSKNKRRSVQGIGVFLSRASRKIRRRQLFPFFPTTTTTDTCEVISTQSITTMAEKTENAPLISSSQAQVAAAAGAGAINAASSKIKKATQDGPLTFRIMGFIGGLAMIVSNGLGIVDRFMSFNFTGSLIAIYGCLFGIMSKESAAWNSVDWVVDKQSSHPHSFCVCVILSQSPCWKCPVSIVARAET